MDTTTKQPPRSPRRSGTASAKPDGQVPAAPVPGKPGMPGSPRLRRRPLFIGLGVATVCLGALLGVWAWTSGTTQTEVVALRGDVQRGAVIRATDLVRVRVGLDPSLKTVPAAGMASLVGKRAAQDMTGGSLVNPAGVVDSVVPAEGMAIVGLSFQPSQLPATQLRNGDQVRVVSTPPKGGEVKGVAKVVSATVASVTAVGDSKTGSSQVVVDLLVPAVSAPDLAVQANSGGYALILDAREK